MGLDAHLPFLDARSMSETAVVRQLTDRLNGVDITCALCSTLACHVVLISSVMATQPRNQVRLSSSDPDESGPADRTRLVKW